MLFMCIAYEEEQTLNDLSREEWQALRQETMGCVELVRMPLLLETQVETERRRQPDRNR